MTKPLQSVFFVGTPAEVAHHAAPLKMRLPYSIADGDEVIQRARPGDLAIFYSEHFDRFRDACRVLQQKQVATLYLIDGILEWRNAWENHPEEPACPYAMRPVLSHKAACIGQSQSRILDGWGNFGKTEIVGIPRLDDFPTRSQRSPAADEFRILVMTAKTPGFTPEQVQRVRQSLLDLKTWFDQNSTSKSGQSFEVIWRLTGGMDEAVGVENQLDDLTGSELAEVLSNVDAVISTQSTAMLEAMLLDLPVAALDYHNCPSYLQTAWSIRSPETIEPVLAELRNPPERKLLFQRNELQDTLYRADAEGQSATDRLERLITEMLCQSADCVAANQPLSFPTRILDRPYAPCIAEFDHGRIYPHATEFKTGDLTQVQVELSHARREIRHLQKEKAQLQSELDLAHEIFEQIHQHPVAGPIVRLRQRIIDWIDGFKNRRANPGDTFETENATEETETSTAPTAPLLTRDESHVGHERQVTTL